MKKFLCFLLSFVLAGAIFCGCGADSAPTEAATFDTASANDAANAGYRDDAKTEGLGQALPGAQDPAAKFIVTVSLSIESTEFEKTMDRLNTLTEQYGGFYEYYDLSSASSYRYASVTARIPKDRHQEFLTSVGEACHVVNETLSSENITTQYYDAELRLETLNNKFDRLQTLLTQAETMADIITIETAISETEYEIEQIKGTLRQYDTQVEYCTVQIHLAEVSKLSNVETAPIGFGQRLQTALVTGAEHFADGFQDFLVFLSYHLLSLLVFLAVLALIFFAVFRLRRRLRGNQAARIKKTPQTAPDKDPMDSDGPVPPNGAK